MRLHRTEKWETQRKKEKEGGNPAKPDTFRRDKGLVSRKTTL